MKCSNCGNENRDGAKVCSKCRTQLAGGYPAGMQPQPQQATLSQGQQQQAAQVQQATVQTQTPQTQTQGATCANCGTVNRAGAKICARCRSPLAAPAQVPAPEDYIGLQAIRSKLNRMMYNFREELKKNKDSKEIKKILVFQGDTGTGKTTVANSFAYQLLQSGCLQSSAIIKTWARDILDTLNKKGLPPNATGIKEYLDKEKPGVIIIYGAVEDPKFLHELIFAFARSEHNFVSIFLGLKERFDKYFTEQIEDKQKIDAYFDFPIQTDEELAAILKQKLVNKNFMIQPDAEALLKDYIIEEKHKSDVKHKNGHLVEKTCLAAILDQQFSNWETNGSNPADEKIITIDDIPIKTKPKSVDEILTELEAMVGMTEVKKTVRGIAETAAHMKKIAEMEGGDYKGGSNHIVITGNPGTGKTTIVRTLGSLFKLSGILQSDSIVEVQGSDLKGSYVGQSKDKVNELCDSAVGRILFIDEAYTLTNEQGPIDQFAQEAIGVLLARLENDRNKYVCVIAGYSRHMETFLDKSNPGMRSRFIHYINIPDYTADELIEIFERFNVEKEKYTITDEAKKRAREVIREMVISKGENFGNVRDIRNFFDKTKTRLASRFRKLPLEEQLPEKMRHIEKEDIAWDKKEAVPIDEVLADLEKMVGMTDVKKMVRGLAQNLQMQQKRVEKAKADAAERGEEYKPKGDAQERNNIVITGNPGTGKTTIVRTLAKLFRSIGLTTRDAAVECLGSDLKGTFIGEAKEKVHSFCNRAMGGILFIDEAYTLVNENGPVDQYANEAIVTLLARMENDGTKFITIAAGYQKEMDIFIEKSNPGMRSRFVHNLHIADYTADELIKIFFNFNAKPAGFTFTDDATEEAKKVIRNMVSSKGPTFGNAREMRELFNRIKSRQSSRLYEMSQEEQDEKINIIEAVDIRGTEEKTLTMEEVLADLETMTGMAEVKKTVRSIATLISTQKKREDFARAAALEKGEKWEPKAEQKQGNHILLTGNPGTGKTTIVRSLAKLFKAIGALPTDKIIEINGNDLKGQYQGETPKKVNEYCRQALGGILFIDEAYVLANEQGPVDGYAKEAGDTLITNLENAKDKFICIAAGYPTNMGLFLDKLNTGMKSRFNHFINIENYSAAELFEIFEKGFVTKNNYMMSDEAKDAAKKAIDAMVRKRLPDFGNAREMRRLYEDVLRRQAKRVSALSEDLQTHEAFSTIETADIGEALKPISIDDVLAELDAMVGMNEVKVTVRSIANTIAHNQKILEKTGKLPDGEGNNIVITGNPGTGKTTIVRSLAKLFKAIGLLPDDNPLEIQGNDLKGSYLGQSKDKVNEFCRQAYGRVFLIDEAYSLVNESGPTDQYAAEAITVLLAKLENERDKYVTVVAGYQKEMDTFIKKSNPGMESRFKHYINIPDYTADELIEIFERFNVKKAGYTLTDAAKEKAHEAIRKIVANKSRTFGNAREIRTFFEKIKSNTASRVSKLPDDQQDAVLQIIEAEDVPGASGVDKPAGKPASGVDKPGSGAGDPISSSIDKILERKKPEESE